MNSQLHQWILHLPPRLDHALYLLREHQRILDIHRWQKKQKILCIGDSISANVDIGALEVATQRQFVKAKAYSSKHDTVSNSAKQAAKFPDSNFTDVIPTELKKEKYEHLILQAGSLDITNMNTKDEPSKYVEYFKQE